MKYTIKFFETPISEEVVETKVFTGLPHVIVDEAEKYLSSDLDYRSFEIDVQFDTELERLQFKKIVEVGR